MKNLETVKKDLQELFDAQRLAVLATQQGGQPYSNLVAFASSKDLKALFFATSRATRKYANLLADSRVALLIDNRSNEISDFRWAKAVTATGEAEEIDPIERDALLKVYLTKHPYLRDFVSSPSCALLKIRVEAYHIVTQFQNVIEVHVKS